MKKGFAYIILSGIIPKGIKYNLCRMGFNKKFTTFSMHAY